MKKREEFVDVAKGITITLVIIGHVLDEFSLTGNVYIIHNFIYSFHMPLFFLLSGYIYGITTKINNFKEYIVFIKKKWINLFIPYLIFSYIFDFIIIIFGKVLHKDIDIKTLYTIPIKPIFHFWFIYVLLFLFTTIAFIELVFKEKYKLIFYILVLLKIFLAYINTPIYIINLMMSFGVFFYGGKYIALYKKDIIMNKNKLIIISIIFFILWILNLNISYGFNSIIDNINNILVAFSGSFFIILISFIICKNKSKMKSIFLYLGENSFKIYLIHRIFTHGSILILMKAKINNTANIIISSLIGIILSIIIIETINKYIPKLNIIFNPLKKYNAIKNMR